MQYIVNQMLVVDNAPSSRHHEQKQFTNVSTTHYHPTIGDDDPYSTHIVIACLFSLIFS